MISYMTYRKYRKYTYEVLSLQLHKSDSILLSKMLPGLSMAYIKAFLPGHATIWYALSIIGFPSTVFLNRFS